MAALVKLLDDYTVGPQRRRETPSTNPSWEYAPAELRQGIAEALELAKWAPDGAEERAKLAVAARRYSDVAAQGLAGLPYLMEASRIVGGGWTSNSEESGEYTELVNAWSAIEDPQALDVLLEWVKSETKENREIRANAFYPRFSCPVPVLQAILRLIESESKETASSRLHDLEELHTLGLECTIGIRFDLIVATMIKLVQTEWAKENELSSQDPLRTLLKQYLTRDDGYDPIPKTCGPIVAVLADCKDFQWVDELLEHSASFGKDILMEQSGGRHELSAVNNPLMMILDHLGSNWNLLSTSRLRRIADVAPTSFRWHEVEEIQTHGTNDFGQARYSDHSTTNDNLCKELRELVSPELSRRKGDAVSGRCPSCKKTVKGKGKHVGKTVKCPGCGEKFVFGDADEAERVDESQQRSSNAPSDLPCFVTFTELAILEEHVLQVNAVCVSDDGKFALSGSQDSTVKLWDLENQKCIRTFEGHTDGVTSVCLSGDGRYGLSGTETGAEDTTMKMWDLESGDCLLTSDEHPSFWVSSLCISDDGRFAVSVSNDVLLWELSNGYLLQRVSANRFS